MYIIYKYFTQILLDKGYYLSVFNNLEWLILLGPFQMVTVERSFFKKGGKVETWR